FLALNDDDADALVAAHDGDGQKGFEFFFTDAREITKVGVVARLPFANRTEFLQRFTGQAFAQFHFDLIDGRGMKTAGGFKDQQVLVFVKKIKGTDVRGHVLGDEFDDFLQEGLHAGGVLEKTRKLADVADEFGVIAFHNVGAGSPGPIYPDGETPPL